AVGVGGVARVQPPADDVDDHPAAMHQADAAAVDEPLRDPDDVDGADLDRRRRGDHDADRPRALRREPAGAAAAVLRVRARLFFLYCYPIARWTLRLEAKYAVDR